jgi:hypothetical protein
MVVPAVSSGCDIGCRGGGLERVVCAYDSTTSDMAAVMVFLFGHVGGEE